MLARRLMEEIAKVKSILARRGALYEDEQSRLDTLLEVEQWYYGEQRGSVPVEQVRAAEASAEPAQKIFKGLKLNTPRREL